MAASYILKKDYYSSADFKVSAGAEVWDTNLTGGLHVRVAYKLDGNAQLMLHIPVELKAEYLEDVVA